MRFGTAQVWAVIGFASLIWLALSAVGVTSGGGLQLVFSLKDVIPALIFVAFVFERWLWRQQLFHRVGVVTTPVVIGTWRGDLHSFWKENEDDDAQPVRTVYLAIRQTAMTITVRLLSDEAVSEHIAGNVVRLDSGYPSISYIFRGEPQLRFRKGNVSPMYYGAARVEIVGDPATELNGPYWTDRETTGQVRFTEHSPVVAQTFDEAAAMAFGPPAPVGVVDALPFKLRTRKLTN